MNYKKKQKKPLISIKYPIPLKNIIIKLALANFTITIFIILSIFYLLSFFSSPKIILTFGSLLWFLIFIVLLNKVQKKINQTSYDFFHDRLIDKTRNKIIVTRYDEIGHIFLKNNSTIILYKKLPHNKVSLSTIFVYIAVSKKNGSLYFKQIVNVIMKNEPNHFFSFEEYYDKLQYSLNINKIFNFIDMPKYKKMKIYSGKPHFAEYDVTIDEKKRAFFSIIKPANLEDKKKAYYYDGIIFLICKDHKTPINEPSKGEIILYMMSVDIKENNNEISKYNILTNDSVKVGEFKIIKDYTSQKNHNDQKEQENQKDEEDKKGQKDKIDKNEKYINTFYLIILDKIITIQGDYQDQKYFISLNKKDLGKITNPFLSLSTTAKEFDFTNAINSVIAQALILAFSYPLTRNFNN